MLGVIYVAKLHCQERSLNKHQKRVTHYLYTVCIAGVYGAQRWFFISKELNKLKICQTRMERSLLGIYLRKHMPNTTIRCKAGWNKRVETQFRAQKYSWAAHVSRSPCIGKRQKQNDTRTTVQESLFYQVSPCPEVNYEANVDKD